ncbi:hypothetical protein AAFF_G00013450 [Aldrovandia affinis]|uniref:Uncharacterized protein n=1 Tax=Aldrovandia affinis TaxID=143900 RepID=A0AAD7WH01_9TELE|nr:hypothetical protein AAFF_G00013450 [Aldrovandia affinis]
MAGKKEPRSARKTAAETGLGGAPTLPGQIPQQSISPRGEEDCGDRGRPLDLEIFIKAIDGLKQDIYDKLDSKIDSFSTALRSEMALIRDELNSAVATLQITVDTHGSTIKDLERSATSCSNDLGSLNKTVKALKDELKVVKSQIKGVQAKCDDLEGRSRRNNIRLVGVPEGREGPRPGEFISKFLQDILHLDEAPLLDRVHRSRREKPGEGAPPQPFINRVHYFHVREEILRRAREAAPLLHQGKRLSIFADFAPSVAKLRAEFGSAKRLLRAYPGVGLFFPAELRITLPGGALRKFTDPAAAVNFINRDLGSAVPPTSE